MYKIKHKISVQKCRYYSYNIFVLVSTYMYVLHINKARATMR